MHKEISLPSMLILNLLSCPRVHTYQLSASHPPSKRVGARVTSPSAIAPAAALPHPLPSAEDLATYDAICDAEQSSGGFVDGLAARRVFLGSQLPMESLAALWRLADMDGDGQLSRREFRVAMHLAVQASDYGVPVPARLSPELLDALGASRFDVAVELCERRIVHGEPIALSRALPSLLRECFEDDVDATLQRSERTLLANVTCLCPTDGVSGDQLFNDELLRFQAAQTREGRQCRGGACGDACSRVALAGLASAAECDEMRRRAAALMASHGSRPEGRSPHLDEAVAREETSLSLDALAAGGDVRALLLFVRLLERVRRAIAREYGLPLNSIFADSGFVSRISARAAPASYGIVHADESSSDRFHYSALLYLNSQHEGSEGDGSFGGGEFVFSDAPVEQTPSPWRSPQPSPVAGLTTAIDAAGRSEWRLAPVKGRALLFSGGLENVHYVAPVTGDGERFAIGTFWTTAPAELEEPSQDLAQVALGLLLSSAASS